jgi:hypothetical protein
MICRGLGARITVDGYVIFIVTSIAWTADGWVESKASLVVQNVVLLLINALDVWRWFPKAEKEAKSYLPKLITRNIRRGARNPC